MTRNIPAEFFGRMFSQYNKRIYPHIKNYRGATRLNEVLSSLADFFIPNAEGDITKIQDENWDNLIILDACRHDLFEDVIAQSNYRFSRASSSAGFISKNFGSGDWNDVIYISANPHTNPDVFKNLTGRNIEDVFHEVFQVFESSWDNENNTVMPEDVADAALTAKKLFPNKKLIIHFMQPHYPFIGSDDAGAGFEDMLDQEEGKDVWTKMASGEVKKEDVISDYQKNLEIVWRHVKPMIDEIGGLSIITADHGNFIGEYGIYGHPEGINAEPVRKVPFFKYRN